MVLVASPSLLGEVHIPQPWPHLQKSFNFDLNLSVSLGKELVVVQIRFILPVFYFVHQQNKPRFLFILSLIICMCLYFFLRFVCLQWLHLDIDN